MRSFGVEGPVLWLLLALALLVSGVFSQAPVLVDHDVGFILHSASRMLDGAALYQDIVDPNPPAIFFLNLPPAWAARLTGLPATAVFKAYVVVLVILSLVLCAGSLRHALPSQPQIRACLLVVLLTVLLPGARSHFGQREHLMLVAVMPYVLSAAAWTVARPPHVAFSVLVGILAGIGAALKPYFLAVWILLELDLAFTRGPASIWRRKENWAIGLVQVAQVAYILFAAPAYYRQVIPLTWELYGAGNARLQDLLLNPATLLSVLALILLYVVPAGPDLRQVRRVVAIACVAVLLAALGQKKGWGYHFYPPAAAAALLFAMFALDLVLWVPGMQRRFWRACLVGTAAGALTLTQRGPLPTSKLVYSLADLIHQQAPGEEILIFSPGEYPAFPTVNYAGARWSSRFSSVWFLVELYSHVHAGPGRFPYRRPDEMGPTEKYVFGALVSDLLKTPPRLVMIDCQMRSIGGGASFDVIQYLSQDPSLAALWQDYKYLATISCIHIFKRTPTPAVAE